MDYKKLAADLLARAEAAEARAEKAERNLDVAIKELNGVSNAVGDLADFIDDQIYPLVQYDMYVALHNTVYAITRNLSSKKGE